MELSNEFEVGVPVDEAWALLTDLERIAPCLPGAQLKEVEGDEFRGVVKVKVGPITAQYEGQAHFVDSDPVTHRAVLTASGRDRRGQGNASATITAQLTGVAGRTHVSLVTDLAITGKVAQFGGRGVLADVSTKLLAQFVANLEEMLLTEPAVQASGQDAPTGPDGAGDREADVVAQVKAAQRAATKGSNANTKAGAAAQASKATKKAAANKPAANKPAANKPAANKPAAKEVAAKKVAAKKTTTGAAKKAAPAAAKKAATADEAPTGAAPEAEPKPEPKPEAKAEIKVEAGIKVEAKPEVRRIDSPEAEPVDLLDAAGSPVLKRLLPAVALILAVLIAFRLARRRAHRKN